MLSEDKGIANNKNRKNDLGRRVRHVMNVCTRSRALTPILVMNQPKNASDTMNTLSRAIISVEEDISNPEKRKLN